MNRKKMGRAPSRTGGHWLVLAAVPIGILAACNAQDLLNVKAPDRVPASTFDSPAQAALMVNSAAGDFECAVGSYVLVEGIISDELGDAQLGAAAWPYDRRDANTQPGGSYGTAPCTSSQTPGIYLPLSTARWAADDALTKLQAWTDQEVPGRSALIAKAALYAGFGYSAMGMSMCQASFDLGKPIDQPAMFAEAEKRFTIAIDEGTKAGTSDVVNAALVGRARVRLFQANLQGAAADAQLVPVGFVFNASAGSDDNRRYNRVYAATTQFGDYTVEPGSRALTTEGVPDPRAAAALMTTRAADAKSTIWSPTKYTSDATPIPIARYEEAQLILAEAQGGTAAVSIINALRDAVGVPHYSGATDAASITQLIISERQRALFVEGFRNYDIQRFKIPLNPPAGTPYPIKGGTYGNTTCLPLPDIEHFNNPNA
jgi:hypothetical protein